MSETVQKTEAEWRNELDPEEYARTPEGRDRAPVGGQVRRNEDRRRLPVPRLRRRAVPESDTKFDSHCGWPSFFAPATDAAVDFIEDRTMGMRRTEVRCAACDSHLGHVFEGEGYDTPTDQRFCINSISLTLEPDDSADQD